MSCETGRGLSMYSEVLFAEEEPPYAGKKSRGAD